SSDLGGKNRILFRCTVEYHAVLPISKLVSGKFRRFAPEGFIRWLEQVTEFVQAHHIEVVCEWLKHIDSVSHRKFLNQRVFIREERPDNKVSIFQFRCGKQRVNRRRFSLRIVGPQVYLHASY